MYPCLARSHVVLRNVVPAFLNPRLLNRGKANFDFGVDPLLGTLRTDPFSEVHTMLLARIAGFLPNGLGAKALGECSTRSMPGAIQVTRMTLKASQMGVGRKNNYRKSTPGKWKQELKTCCPLVALF